MRTLSLCALMLAAPLVQAAAPAELEWSAGVSGDLVIDAQGAVHSWRMDDGLAPTVQALVQRTVEGWRFEPVVIDGKPVNAKTRMRLALLATPAGDGDYRLRVDEVFFGEAKVRPDQPAPKYPRDAIRAGMEARVVVLARLDENGKVVEVAPYQTSLSKKGSVARWRKAFETATLDAVRQWSFEPGEEIQGERRGNVVKMPIEYNVAGGRSRRELMRDMKRWRAYIPGPIEPLPAWADAAAAQAIDDAALDDGRAIALESRFKLASDVVGKAL